MMVQDGNRARSTIAVVLGAFLLVFVGAIAGQEVARAGVTIDGAGPAAVTREAPLVFEANRGQLPAEAAFASRADGYEVLLDSAGASLVLAPGTGRPGAILRLAFRDALPSAAPMGIEELRGRVSYLTGSEPASWTSGIPTFAAVTRTAIYPAVTLTYRSDGGGLQIELVLSPGADEESIRLGLEGADSLGIDASTGDLVVSVRGTEVRLLRPEAAQTLPAGSSIDAGGYVMAGPQEAGILTPRHDPSSPLVLRIAVAGPREIGHTSFVDPVRIATDQSGNAYVTGRVASLPGQEGDAYVTKIAPDGRTRLFTTYFGGEGEDVPLGIAVDAGGHAVVTGRTGSADFPLLHAAASNLSGRTDVFVAKLAPDGASFVYSTYLGGEGEDEGRAIDLDEGGTAWVTGRTSGEGLPVGRDAAQSVSAGGWDAFVAGLSPDGSRLPATTLAGGSGDDAGNAIRTGRDGTVYFAGSTDSADFPVLAALQATLANGGSGAGDAFVAAMDPATGRFLFTTYLGGAGEDSATGLGVDREGALHVAGRTTSADLPPGNTPGAPGRFVAVLSPGGTELRQILRLAAPPGDASEGFAVDDAGDCWVAGGGALAVKVAADGLVLDRIDSSMSGETRVTGVALAPGGGAFVAGLTTGGAFPGAMALESPPCGGLAFAVTGPAPPERIEAAGCPGTIVFSDGDGTGLWQDPGNWTLGRLPNAGDDVCIPAIHAVTLSANTQTINSLYVAAGSSLTVAGGNLAIATPSQIDGTFTLHSGIVSGGGDITTANLFTWDGGSLVGAANFFANAGVSLTGSATRILSSSRVLTIAGATTWTGTGSLLLSSGAAIVNNGTWDCQSDASMTGSSAGFTNSSGAIFKKSAGAGTTTISPAFNNDGTLDLQTGTLSLSGGGTSSGAFQASPGTTLQFSGGVHSLSSSSSIVADSVVFSGNTSNVDGIYAATSGTTVSGGTATFGPSATVISVGPALVVSGGTASFSSGEAITPTTLAVSGGTLRGTDTVTVSGLTTWTAGSMADAGTTNTSGGLSLTGSIARSLTTSRTLSTAGTTTWTGTGNVQVGSSATITNEGTWDCQSDASLTSLGSSGSFTNSPTATFKKSAGGGTTLVSIPFNNDGTVTLQSGTLSLSGGGTSTGAFQGSPGTTFRFSGNLYAHTLSSSIAADNVVVSAGTTNVDGSYAATSGTTVSGGTANFNSSATVTSIGNALVVTAATASFSSGETITPATLSLSAGTLRGTDVINVSGLTTWTSGTMSDAGVTNANGGISFTGASSRSLTLSRALTTAGTTTWTGTGSIQVGSGAAITNDGTWDCQSDATLASIGAPGPFTNSQTAIFKKSAGGGTTLVSIPFNNDGTVTLQSGTLSLSGGGTSTGAFQGSPGTTLRFSGSVYAHTPSSSIAADGVVFSAGTTSVDGSYAAASGTTVSGGTANFNPSATVTSIGTDLTVAAGTANFSSGETISPTTLNLSAGTLRGTDTVAVSGLTTWTAGTMTDAGATNTDGGLSLTGASSRSLTSSRVLTTAGTTTWTAGSFQIGLGASITNNGTWDCQSDALFVSIGAPGPFTNSAAATFKKSAGGGTSGVAPSFHNEGSVQALAGVLQFTGGYTQTAGSTILDGGSVSSSLTMDIQGGTLTGAGTVTANVTSAGNAAPGLPLGALSITGNYTQSPAGSLDVSLGGTNGGVDYDQLHLTGTGVASLAGTLNVDLVNGFSPTGGESFTLLTFTSATGTFSSTNLPPAEVGCWLLQYNPTSVVLEYPGASEVTDVAFAGDGATLSWSPLPPQAGPAPVYDVIRGLVSELPVGDKPGETCLASMTSATSTTDATLPVPGAGFYYLVRGANACGLGSYGFTSGGSQRISTVCP